MQKKKNPKQPEHASQKRIGDEEGGGGGGVGAEGLGEEKIRRKRASVLSCSKACGKERVRRAGASVLSLPIPRWKVLYSASFPLRAGIYTLSMYVQQVYRLSPYILQVYILSLRVQLLRTPIRFLCAQGLQGATSSGSLA
jgi:hypothetical protein